MPVVIVPARTGITDPSFQYGMASRWLFGCMLKLSREIIIAIVTDFGI